MTDRVNAVTPNAFPIMGVSGFIEVVGLTLWAYELVRNMRVGMETENRKPAVEVRPLTAAPIQSLRN